MTPFQVGWDPDTEDELARLCLRAADRNALSRAVDQAERQLTNDPVHHGRVLSKGLHSLVVPPIMLIYTLDSAKRAVEVVNIGLVR